MISLGSKSKLLEYFSRPLSQGLKRQARGYVDQKGDEDIKWQWAVRDTPCQICDKYKPKKGWLVKIFKKKKQQEELTNRHKEVKYEPKIWELGYYNYLLPECDKIAKKTKIKLKTAQAQSTSKYVCASRNKECEGKQIMVRLDKDDELSTCTEKLNFQHKEPFCLNEVCGKTKPKGANSCGSEDNQFMCLNHLIQKDQKSANELSEKDQQDCNH